MSVTECKTKAEFDSKLQNAGGKLVVVDFTAQWCGPCRYIKPIFEKMSEEFQNVVFLKVDVDENEETAKQCGIDCMPTFQFFKNGTKVDTLTGAAPDQLRTKIETLTSDDKDGQAKEEQATVP